MDTRVWFGTSFVSYSLPRRKHARRNRNKLVEWKAVVDTVGIKSADLEDKFLFWCFAAFRTA